MSRQSSCLPTCRIILPRRASWRSSSCYKPSVSSRAAKICSDVPTCHFERRRALRRREKSRLVCSRRPLCAGVIRTPQAKLFPRTRESIAQVLENRASRKAEDSEIHSPAFRLQNRRASRSAPARPNLVLLGPDAQGRSPGVVYCAGAHGAPTLRNRRSRHPRIASRPTNWQTKSACWTTLAYGSRDHVYRLRPENLKSWEGTGHLRLGSLTGLMSLRLATVHENARSALECGSLLPP